MAVTNIAAFFLARSSKHSTDLFYTLPPNSIPGPKSASRLTPPSPPGVPPRFSFAERNREGDFMRNHTFIPKRPTEHGGILTVKRRNSKRPLNIQRPVHIVLRSDLAKGKRSLLKNQKIVDRVLAKFSKKFHIKVYEKAICGNHIHCLVKAYSRRSLQNFFRVLAGQIAQEILNLYPLQKNEKKAFRGGTHRKNQKTFWSLLLYSRIVSWGRDFGNVGRYLVRNTLEALGLIPYQERKSRFLQERILTELRV